MKRALALSPKCLPALWPKTIKFLSVGIKNLRTKIKKKIKNLSISRDHINNKFY